MIRLPELSRKFFLPFAVLLSMSVGHANTLQVVTEHHPPVQYMSEGQLKGFAIDIVRALLKKTKVNAEFHVVPWARAYDKALSEPDTLIFSMVRTPEREPLFHWIGPVSQLNVAVIALSERTYSDIQNLDDTRKYLFAVIRDAYSYDYLTENGFSTDKNLFLAATMQEQVNLLLKRKIDFLLTDPLTVKERLRNLGHDSAKIKTLLWIDELSKDLYLAASKKTDIDVVQGLQKSLREMQSTEFYQSRYNLKAQK